MKKITFILIYFFISLGFLLLIIMTWTYEVLFNSSYWQSIISKIGKDPKVVSTISNIAADKTIKLLNIQGKIEDYLPTNLKFVSGSITNTVTDYSKYIISNEIQSQDFQKSWLIININLHDKISSFLQGNDVKLPTKDKKVVLNIYPLIVKIVFALKQNAPIFVSQNIDIPTDIGYISLFNISDIEGLRAFTRYLNIFIYIAIAITALLLTILFLLTDDKKRSIIILGFVNLMIFLIARLILPFGLYSIIPKTNISKMVLEVALMDIIGIMNGIIFLSIILIILGFVIRKPEWFKAGYRASDSILEKIKYENYKSKHRKN